jgi:anti-sigma factor RsiW
MNCDAYRNKIEAYLDAELPEPLDRETFTHISECHNCGQQALAALHTKRLVKSAGMRFAPSAEFRQRVLGANKKPVRPWNLRWIFVALAALVIVAAAFLLRPASNSANEIADLHVSMLASANPYDVVSSDKHTVKPWFQGKLPFAFDLPELPDATFTLAGGRLVYLQGSPAAELVYMYGKHHVSVFVTQRPTGARSGNYNGFSIVSWQRNGLAYTAITDASPDAVHKLAALFQK